MLLAIDVGNSNISLGIFKNRNLLMKGKISVETRRSADEYAAIVYGLMRMNQISREEVNRCILASAAPELTLKGLRYRYEANRPKSKRV